MSNDVEQGYNNFTNYDLVQDETKKSVDMSFPVLYSKAMNELCNFYSVPLDLQKILQDKRDFGLKKYGERSFQGSLENTLSVPIWLHLHDELVDAINYSLHYIYRIGLAGEEGKREKLEEILKILLDLIGNKLERL